ncbi:acetolactate synthase large subunit [Salininema proteolyticum]|uniref:Acetolactate synthase n=1 Tax=Salininema proteolyticum TaxID=1607685 RepID=A0ABV8U0U1_9ACTN
MSTEAKGTRPKAAKPAPPPRPREQADVALSGAELLVKTLEKLDVEAVFGIPGGAILPTYDPLLDSSAVRHVLVRHEQGAGHAATGYAAATGKVGVCMATSGPGATNLVTPLADAHMDSIPIVAITGQVARSSIGTDAFQEADIHGITMPITKHSYLVENTEDIPRILAEAFHIASTGRPGPVLVDIPKDVQAGKAAFSWPPTMHLPGYRPVIQPHSKQIREAASLLAQAKRPVLYAGGGIIKSGAHQELRTLADQSGVPVCTTLMALGAFPDDHPQHVGMPGMHGSVPAVYTLQNSDLIVALGARFDDRVTGKLDTFAPDANIVHVDIDPAEIGKNRTADVPIVGDCKAAVTAIIEAYGALTPDASRLVPWWDSIQDLKKRYPLGYEKNEGPEMAPQYVIERLNALAPEDTVWAAGVGQHQMWASQFVTYTKPRTFLNSGGLGTMGYAVPAAMGAQMGHPGRTVWAIDGDGCFQMTNQELATCAIEGLPIKVAVINNGNLGMVRQWQTLFYDSRYSNTDLSTHRPSGDSEAGAPTRRGIPDFVALAEALGCVGLRAETPEEVDRVIEQAQAINDRPVVVDFIVGKDAMVWPMVPSGLSNDEILYARDLRPQFEEGEEL